MRLLIIEDEEKIALPLKKGLEQEGYAVDWIAEGEKAQQRISLYRNEYDLIILDLMLPGIPGQEICRAVRADGVTIPILVLTARDLIEDKVNLPKSGRMTIW
jgi:two-component system response regulator QseB